MTYSVKEIYYTLQGEGAQTGRPAVFLRFAGCNLWTGREKDRARAICNFCDTEFVGTDGPGGTGRRSAPRLPTFGSQAIRPPEETADLLWDALQEGLILGGPTFRWSDNSGAAIRGQRGGAHYSAAKGAVMAWTRTVAQEWAPYGITVNAVLPAIWTPMYDSYRSHMSPEQLAMHDRGMQFAIPLGGRLGDADQDLGPVMVFLASEMSRFITGQAVAVDGGMVMLG